MVTVSRHAVLTSTLHLRLSSGEVVFQVVYPCNDLLYRSHTRCLRSCTTC
jgi:hypothetical protein